MFAITALAQSPYASLGGNTYLVSISDSVTSTDTLSSFANFVGTTSESSSFTDSDVGQFNFFETVADTQFYSDQYFGYWNTNASTLESQTLTDSLSATQNFPVTVTDTATYLDSLLNTGWAKINDNQTVTWTQVYNVQNETWQQVADVPSSTNTGGLFFGAAAFGQSPYSGSSTTGITGPNWTDINDIQ